MTMRETKRTESGSPTTGEREIVAEKAKRARDARREIRLGESAGGSDEARKAKNVKDEKKRRPREAKSEMMAEEAKTASWQPSLVAWHTTEVGQRKSRNQMLRRPGEAERERYRMERPRRREGPKRPRER